MQTMQREENVDCLLIPMKHLEHLEMVSFELLFKECMQ